MNHLFFTKRPFKVPVQFPGQVIFGFIIVHADDQSGTLIFVELASDARSLFRE